MIRVMPEVICKIITDQNATLIIINKQPDGYEGLVLEQVGVGSGNGDGDEAWTGLGKWASPVLILLGVWS